MASFEDLMIGFNDNGYNTVDSFVDRTKELPTKNVSIYEIDFNPLNDANDSEEDKIENALRKFTNKVWCIHHYMSIAINHIVMAVTRNICFLADTSA